MQALRAAQHWVNQEGWDAAGEAKAVDSNGAGVDLHVPMDAEGRPLILERCAATDCARRRREGPHCSCGGERGIERVSTR